jgi:hypothetical protein
MRLDTPADLLAVLGLVLSFGVLLGGLVQYRRRPEPLTAAITWLGLALTVGAGKQFAAASGSVRWVALFGVEVACLAFAFWQLGRHIRATGRRGST